jgi:hypothetical protein
MAEVNIWGPEDYYRAGVEAGTAPFPLHEVCGRTVNDLMGERRKKLITKKVTKWVVVLKAGKFTEECVDRGRLWALKSAAEEYVKNQIGNSCLGVFPLEIEVPNVSC